VFLRLLFPHNGEIVLSWYGREEVVLQIFENKEKERKFEKQNPKDF